MEWNTEVMDVLKKQYQGAISPGDYLSEIESQIIALSELYDEHPEWWDLPCLCDECKSCA